MPKILIAEDSFALANLLEFVLKRSGFYVRVARHGAQALSHAEQNSYDSIVLDQQMPGMTGIEVLTKIRAAGLNQSTPVYLCTAKTHELDLARLQTQLNIEGVFHKPFSPRDLVATLRGTLAPSACT